MRRIVLSLHWMLILSLFICGQTLAGEIGVGYLTQETSRAPAVANIDDSPENEGLAGATLAIQDNNTTGKFTGHAFNLVSESLSVDADVDSAIQRLKDAGIRFLILDLEASALDQVLAMNNITDLLLFNVRATDRRFRDIDCHPQLLHTALSRDMQTDALTQYLVKKRWTDWFLVTGRRPEDALFAEAIARSAKKFGAKIVEQKQWLSDHDIRRVAPSEMPLFTQVGDYDVLMVADENGDFGDYILFQTWSPSLVAGTQGLVAQSWGRPIEQWGAAQLQERFVAEFGRWMRPRDYAAWIAVRSIGEAALRTAETEYEAIRNYIKSDQFELAAFKGRKLTFRAWNGQMRQPVPLMWARSLVAQTPIDGFLHQRTELDTLGLDQPESKCSFETSK